MTDVITHDPDANLDYRWDWSAWLEPGETITSHTITVNGPDAALVLGAHSHDASSVTAWLSGGTEREAYGIRCHIVTSAARADDRTLTLSCWDR
jgi:hypothetical protein